VGAGRELPRWRAVSNRRRQIACLGDSLTQGAIGLDRSRGPAGWVEQLAASFDTTTAPRPGDGFRGLWRIDEWSRVGAWTRVEPSETFDTAPFGQGWYSSGSTLDSITWTKPAPMNVVAFDIYSFHMPGAGRWQYRVDDGRWTNVDAPSGPADCRLSRLLVRTPVQSCVKIRGHDGTSPCLAPIAGLATHAIAPPAPGGVVVHNLGSDRQLLATFVRPTAGDALALLDDLRPDLLTVMFSNDVLRRLPAAYGEQLVALVEHVRPYADVLIMGPFEQAGTRDAAMQASYRLEAKAAAAATSCAFMDLFDEWGALAGRGWEAAMSFGLMHDELHPSQAGQDDIATRVRALLTRADTIAR
jgi:lysophospholipase L1-like esterase